MESKISYNTEFSKIKNHRKMCSTLKKLTKLNLKKKSLEACNFQRSASIIFMKDKFKISNEFDHKGIKTFLKEKFKYLEPMNLNDSLIEIKKHHKQKYPKYYGRTVSKKKFSKYQSNLFDSGLPKIPINNSPTTMNRLFSNNSLCLKDLLSNLI